MSNYKYIANGTPYFLARLLSPTFKFLSHILFNAKVILVEKQQRVFSELIDSLIDGLILKACQPFLGYLHS